MSEIAKTIGQRVRNYRIEKGLSQEKLAELSGCHPTYIGQVERGEKNATLESIEKIASAMNISLAQLFEKIGESSTDSYPMKCYELVAAPDTQTKAPAKKRRGPVSCSDETGRTAKPKPAEQIHRQNGAATASEFLGMQFPQKSAAALPAG